MSGQNIFVLYKKSWLFTWWFWTSKQEASVSKLFVKKTKVVNTPQDIAYLDNDGRNSWILGGILSFQIDGQKKSEQDDTTVTCFLMDSLKYIGDKVVVAASYIFPNLVCSFKK